MPIWNTGQCFCIPKEVAVSDDNEKNGSDFDFDFDSFAEQSESVDTSQPFESNDLGGDVSPFATADFEPVTDDGGVSADNPFFAESSPEAADVAEPVSLAKSEKPEKSADRESVFSTNDIPGILCLAAAGALVLIMLVQNVMSLLFHTDSIFCAVCYVASFDIIGLGAVTVPVLIYKRRAEIGLFNVLLGVSAAALFGGVLIMLTEFYHYGFVIKP
ncbi:hypothetical protein FACS1894170_10990 [Planctomycetales bacterium]|nr:hypothetical protein FACS1894170_10990 [Planctomycetales bacterium]